ncbi:hypothetical protein pipiens_001591, partial [Culex pipiens pipiens]
MLLPEIFVKVINTRGRPLNPSLSLSRASIQNVNKLARPSSSSSLKGKWTLCGGDDERGREKGVKREEKQESNRKNVTPKPER